MTSDMVVQSVGAVRTQIRTGVVPRHTIDDVTNRQMRKHFQRPLMGISSMQTRRFSVCCDENNNDYIMRSQFSGVCSDCSALILCRFFITSSYKCTLSDNAAIMFKFSNFRSYDCLLN